MSLNDMIRSLPKWLRAYAADDMECGDGAGDPSFFRREDIDPNQTHYESLVINSCEACPFIHYNYRDCSYECDAPYDRVPESLVSISVRHVDCPLKRAPLIVEAG